MTETFVSTPTAPRSPTIWCGWRRLRGLPWAKVCEGPSESDAIRQLLDIAAEMGGHADGIVLPHGRHPDDSRRRR
jgi:hypothetical protein